MTFSLTNFVKNAQVVVNNLPCAAWYKNTQLEYIGINKNLEDLTRVSSKNIVGHDDYQLPWKKYAEDYRHVDKEILSGKSLAILHPVILGNNSEITVISRKKPIKDDANNIVGIMGLVTIVDRENAIKFSKVLEQVDTELIATTNYTSQPCFLNYKYKNYKLSEKDMQCLYFLVKGKSAKEMAKLFNLSYRTIESRLEIIKQKLHCQTKSELINKIFENGLFNILPGINANHYISL